MLYFGICIDLANRYRLDSLPCIDQCTLQYCIRIFNSILKIFQCSVIWDVVLWTLCRFGEQIWARQCALLTWTLSCRFSVWLSFAPAKPIAVSP